MAVAFRLDDDLDAEYLVLAERPDGTGRTLEVQRDLTDSEDDVDLGMDTYCLVIGAGPTHYGGVQDWAASDDTLSLQLTAEGTAALGAESLLETPETVRHHAASMPRRTGTPARPTNS